MKDFFKKNKIFNINLLYVLSLIPVILFAYWKNGYLMYKHDYMSFFKSTQYIVIPIVILVLSYVFEIYYYVVYKKEENLDNVFNTIVPFANTLCYLVCGPMDKLYITVPIIIVLDIVLKFMDSKYYINQVALFKILLFGFLSIIGMYNNANLYERATSLSFDLSDYFLGRGVGEIGVTCALASILGFVILLFNKYYKSDISISSVISYALICLVMYLVGGFKFSELLINTFTSGFLFVSIFVASFSNATPIVRSGRILYGICIGVLSAIFINIVNLPILMYVIVLVLGFISPFFNKFRVKFD